MREKSEFQVTAIIMRQKGFTLIEMAIVLVIVGLLVGGGLAAIGPALEQTRSTTTKVNMDQAESALLLYVIRNNRLPCPADGSLPNTDSNYGLEKSLSGSSPAICDTSVVAIDHSVLPWKTLGIDEQYSLDGWNRRLSYIPAGGQTAPGLYSLVDNGTPVGCLYRNVTGATVRNNYCDINAQGLTPSFPYGNYIAVYATSTQSPFYGNELTLPNPSGNAAQATVSGYGGRAAYVLISHGKSGLYGWNKGGVQVADPLGTGNTSLKSLNSTGTAGTSGNLGFIQGTPQGQAGSSILFDDYVRWRSAAMLIQLCGSGACGNP
jgi:prepilin-type N-terminal cleavage/methylation domain-containing protein